jgi:hypothetical protein
MTTTEPPIWLLDVDGVINANKPGWSAAPRRFDVTDKWGMTWPLRWAPALIQRIARIHAEGRAEVVWCTTWCPSAQLLEQLWHLPELRRSWTDDLHGYAAVEAKRAAARAVLADGRRLIWTDDDAFPKRGPLVDELTADGRALLIKPDQRRGLQRTDLDDIDVFAPARSILAG